MTVGVNVGAININLQYTNSAIAIGENQMPAWSAHRKTNSGFGFQAGFILVCENTAVILDPDIVDGQINNITAGPNVQSQAY
ncbi:hypothetical protein [Peribacillus kribbensis]|uniref:hypothetical protein n=1 Tax=Peribacillus kribbensis TaxID=356658 RepID=UPI00040A146E|nr:hypothetical protein [Peribacillus kribbensis]